MLGAREKTLRQSMIPAPHRDYRWPLALKDQAFFGGPVLLATSARDSRSLGSFRLNPSLQLLTAKLADQGVRDQLRAMPLDPWLEAFDLGGRESVERPCVVDRSPIATVTFAATWAAASRPFEF